MKVSDESQFYWLPPKRAGIFPIRGIEDIEISIDINLILTLSK